MCLMVRDVPFKVIDFNVITELNYLTNSVLKPKTLINIKRVDEDDDRQFETISYSYLIIIRDLV